MDLPWSECKPYGAGRQKERSCLIRDYEHDPYGLCHYSYQTDFDGSIHNIENTINKKFYETQEKFRLQETLTRIPLPGRENDEVTRLFTLR